MDSLVEIQEPWLSSAGLFTSSFPTGIPFEMYKYTVGDIHLGNVIVTLSQNRSATRHRKIYEHESSKNKGALQLDSRVRAIETRVHAAIEHAPIS